MKKVVIITLTYNKYEIATKIFIESIAEFFPISFMNLFYIEYF